MADVSTGDGLVVLDGDQLRLFRALEGMFVSWAREVSAPERRYPFLVRSSDLDSYDYYDNFPHLGLAVSVADPEALTKELAAAERPIAAVPSRVLSDARLALPSAACYSVYADLRGTTVEPGGTRRTTAAQCFRNEDHFDGLRRLLGFTMREIVLIGSEAAAKEHLETFKNRVLGTAEALQLTMSVDTATDPFFDSNSSRAKLQRLFPVKEEFIVDGLAIGSLNYHRNFFGERCDISLHDGAPAHTSCVAFGVERWIQVLTTRHGDACKAAELVEELT